MEEPNSNSPKSPQYETKLSEVISPQTELFVQIESKEEKIEPEKVIKRKRSNENFLHDSPIKKLHTEKDEKIKKGKEATNNKNGDEKEEKEKEKEPEKEKEKENESNEHDDGEEPAKQVDEDVEIDNEEIHQNDGDDEHSENNHSESGEDFGNNGDNQDGGEYIDSIMKIKKGGNKRGKEMDSGSLERETNNIIDEMNKAYDEDIKSLQQKKPALKKIKVFADIEKALKNYSIQLDFINKDGLNIFEKWLKPQPDGTQPCLFLKRKILETLKSFSLERDQFPQNDLGKIVNKLCLSANEPQDIRKLAKTIIDKWTRLLTDNQISYKNHLDSIESEESNEKSKKKSNLTDKMKSSEVDILNSQKKDVKYVSLPQKNSVEFFKCVRGNNASEKKKKESSEGTKEMYKILQNLRRNKNNL